MSDSSQEKTEEATFERRRRAREKGQVAQSRDLTSTVALAVTFLAIVRCRDDIDDALRRLFADSFTIGATLPKGAAFDFSAVRDVTRSVVLALLPVFLAGPIAGIAASFLQVGPLFSIDPLLPKAERLNPAEGGKKIFLSGDAWMELLRALVKTTALAFAVRRIVARDAERIFALASHDVDFAIAATVRSAGDVLMTTVVTLVFWSAIDLLYQRKKLARDLRMSKDEVKREIRESEGAPEVRQERRRVQEEMLAQADIERMLRSDVVIVNPTHIACALVWDKKDNAPRITAKAKDHMALRMRRIAEERGVPVRHDVGLARALHELEIDQSIPTELYAAVGAVLEWVGLVLAQRGELPSWERPDAEGTQRSGGRADNRS